MEDGAYEIRTDLALETRERVKKNHAQIHGVRFFEEEKGPDMNVSTVIIETENAAKTLRRPRGCYVTLEDPRMTEEDAGYHREISLELARCVRRLLPFKQVEEKSDGKQKDDKTDELEDLSLELDYSVLIVGLGNREVTPDALGPAVIDNLYITRHIIKEFGKYAFGKEHTSRISAIVPGVMAQTGMECVEILRGIVEQTKPDVMITIDALAARSTKRLGRTIQLTDTGITPGSGIGNHRNAINQKSVGIPVISIGVPTVVDAATIVSDAVSDFIEAMSEKQQEEISRTEPRELARKLLSPQLHGMFVTPKDIDDTIKQLSYLISEALNIAFLGNKEQ